MSNPFHTWTIALLCCVALTGCQSTAPAPAVDDPALALVVPSRQLTDDQAMTMEIDLLTSPSDIKSRVDLLWHYRGRFGDPQAERAANRHVLWLIENRPRAAVLASPIAEVPTLPDRGAFDEAKALWLKAVKANPKDPKVLGNAGVFLLKDDMRRGTELLEQAHRLEPDNVSWPQHLAEGYRSKALEATADERHALARLSVAMYERAADRARSIRQRIILLLRAAATAQRLGGDDEKALELANRADELIPRLDEGPDRAPFEHNVHVITGLYSIRVGKADLARDECFALAAEAISGQSVSLSDLDLSLANAMLERGKKDAVLSYLRICEKATQSSEIARWIVLIRAGERPDFSAYFH